VAIASDHGEDFHPDSTPLDTVHLLVDTTQVCAVAEVIRRREPQWRAEQLPHPYRAAAGCGATRG
jgi:hypothetical protein